MKLNAFQKFFSGIERLKGGANLIKISGIKGGGKPHSDHRLNNWWPFVRLLWHRSVLQQPGRLLAGIGPGDVVMVMQLDRLANRYRP